MDNGTARTQKPATFFAAINSTQEVHGKRFWKWLAEAKTLFMSHFNETYDYEALQAFYPNKGIDAIVDAWWVAGLTPAAYVEERLRVSCGK